MKPLPRSSLRRRLTALCSLLTLLALALTGIDSYRREYANLATNLQDRVDELARMIAINARSWVEFGYPDDLTKFLHTVAETMEVRSLAVYGPDGHLFAAAGDRTLVPRQALDLRPAAGCRSGHGILQFPGPDGNVRTASVLVLAADTAMQRSLREFMTGQLVVAVLALVGLGLAARWLLTRLLRPVATLLETTNRVRETEDYSLRATAVADDEIGNLVQAFNAMLQAIQERDRHLADNAGRLEQVVRDRTAELRQALLAAEAATRAKSTFVANMSHEIRTPLNAVLGMTELAMETEDPRELREYLGVIRSAGSNLLGILCDILDLSKIESDKLDLSPVPTELESLLLDALRPLTSRIQSKNIELSFELAPAVATAYLIDDVRLRQVLTNLVGNAIKFTSEGHIDVMVRVVGTVPTAAEPGTDQIEIVVADTGVGIPADRLEAIFTPFTQADNTITRRFAGTGLGLSITSRLVRLMGGTIHVESAVGIGSTFFVRLPLQRCPSPLPPLPPPPPDLRLLLVSASPTQAHSLHAICLRLGIQFRTEPTLAAARSGAAPIAADLVLLDERDPDGDPDICATVPANDLGLRPVLIMTSFQDLASASARCRHNAFAGYITKPISARELAVRIANLGRAPRASDLPQAMPSGHGNAPEAGGGLRILVAEDNAVNQKLIERILQRDGHHVTMAGNGRVCCELWQGDDFDLVLMDMQMPEMSGLEATTRIRRDETNRGRRVPIIALTANTTPEDREACLHAGMDEVLPKPVSIQRLRMLLAQLSKTVAPIPHSPEPGQAER
jgi:two-component system, sensor histidine kinase and response regulator